MGDDKDLACGREFSLVEERLAVDKGTGVGGVEERGFIFDGDF